MKTRKRDWFDTDAMRPVYGIQVRIDGAWRDLAEDGKPCLYLTEKERDAKRREYSRKKEATNGQ